METIRERNHRLTHAVYSKYNSYLRAHRKATKNKADVLLQKDEEIKKLEWLKAVEAKKKGLNS